MKIFCTASADAYITDKIIDQKLRATDANTGRASSLDLFKLYDETKLTGSDEQNELSRVLIKFDLKKPMSMISEKIDVRSSRFKAEIVMSDIGTGHPTPSNFTVVAFPLSKSFDEGVGRNLSAFSDLGTVNFFTASIENGSPVMWHVSGANSIGVLDDDDADVIERGEVGRENFDYYGSQLFSKGNEDLRIDVTNAVSGALTQNLPDYGFRISFSGSDETDLKTRFVKRFGSRHSANPLIRPRLEISYDDSIRDDRKNFYFDTTGSLFLRNLSRSELKNIKHNSLELTGDDCLKVKLIKGSYSKVFNASQHVQGSYDNGTVGIYSSSFAISSDDTSEYAPGKTLKSLIDSEKQVTFKEFWYTNDETKGVFTGSLTIQAESLETSFSLDDVQIKAVNCRERYQREDQEKIRLFGINLAKQDEIPRKRSIKKESEIFEKVYYRVIDADTLQPVFDFDSTGRSTLVSTDDQGMYFNFHFDVLPVGRAYIFEYEIHYAGMKKVLRDKNTRFAVL